MELLEATIPSRIAFPLETEAKVASLVVEKAEDLGMERIIFDNPIMIKAVVDTSQNSRTFFDFLCDNRLILFLRIVMERLVVRLLLSRAWIEPKLFRIGKPT